MALRAPSTFSYVRYSTRLSVSVTSCAKLHQSTPYRANKICTFGAKDKRRISPHFGTTWLLGLGYIRFSMRPSVSVTGCAKLHQSTPYRADKICTFGTKDKRRISAHFGTTWLLGLGYIRFSMRPSTLAALLWQSYALYALSCRQNLHLRRKR